MSISLSAVKRFLGVVLFITLAVGSGIAVLSFVQLPGSSYGASHQANGAKAG